MTNQPPLQIPPHILQQIHNHAINQYPNECCGILLTPKNKNTPIQHHPCTNAQNQYHQHDPKTYPRTAKTAYLIHPQQLLHIHKQTQNNQQQITLIYHSHTDTPAYFSQEDQHQALDPNGNPTHPNTLHLIIAIHQHKITHHKTYKWNPTQKKYTQTTNPLPNP